MVTFKEENDLGIVTSAFQRTDGKTEVEKFFYKKGTDGRWYLGTQPVETVPEKIK